MAEYDHDGRDKLLASAIVHQATIYGDDLFPGFRFNLDDFAGNGAGAPPGRSLFAGRSGRLA